MTSIPLSRWRRYTLKTAIFFFKTKKVKEISLLLLLLLLVEIIPGKKVPPPFFLSFLSTPDILFPFQIFFSGSRSNATWLVSWRNTKRKRMWRIGYNRFDENLFAARSWNWFLMIFDEKFIDTYCLPFLNEIPRVTWKLGVHRGKKVCKESDDSLLVKFITLYSSDFRKT